MKTDSIELSVFYVILPLIFHQLDHNSLLSVETVLSFLKYLICVSLEYLLCDLLLTVCRETMENHCIAVCHCHKVIIYLIACECLLTLFSFAFLTH